MIADLKNLAHSNFVRNVLTVATGTAAAQAITMLFSPLITRLYGPESFGLQGLFMSVLNILIPLSVLGYPTAIVLPRQDHEALGVVKLIMLTATCIALIVCVLFYLAGDWLLDMMQAQSLGSLVYLVPLAIIFSAMSSALSQWMIRSRAYGINARFQVISSLLINSAKSGLGTIMPGPGTLIATNIFGGLVGTLLTFWGWLKWKPKTAAAEPSKNGKSLIEIATEYRDFPIYRTPQHFINSASQSLPIFILASGFGSGSVGYYSIAFAVLAVPAALVSDSVVSVFYPRITAAIQNNENVQKIIIKATAGMALLGLAPYLIVIAFGPEIFQFVFGNEWSESGEYAQWLSIWLYLQFVHKPAAAAVPALNLNKSLLIYEILSSTGKVLALVAGLLYFNSAIASIAMFSIFGLVSYAVLIVWLIRISPTGKDS